MAPAENPRASTAIQRVPAAVWCTALHVGVSGMFLHWGAPPLWLAQTGSLLAIGCGLLALLHRWFRYPVLPLLLLASLGLALQRTPRPRVVSLEEARPVQLQARLREWHVRDDEAWALLDHLQSVEGEPLAPRSSILLGTCMVGTRVLRPGNRLSLEGKLSHDGRSFRLEDFHARRLHEGRAPPILALRQAVRSRLQHALSEGEAGLAIALLLGERRELTPWLQDTYRRFGLVHLLAVSGMHFWLWNALLRRLLRGPLAYARLPLLGLAALLAGGSAPVMRALWVVVLRDLAARWTRPVPGLHLWASAWALELFLLPAGPLGLGFLLSYAATGFLIAGAAPMHLPSWRKTLQASWVAFLGSMPFLHMVQGTVEPWSIPLSPLLGLLLPLRLCAALAALFPGAAPLADAFLGLISRVEALAFRPLEAAPWSPWLRPEVSSLWLMLAAFLGLLLVQTTIQAKRKLRLLLLLLFLLACCAPTPRRAGFSVLQVGHGLAVVVAGQERSLSFDLGSGERAPRDLVERILLPELLRRRWPTPDRAIESHGDRDHVNGYPWLRRRLALRTLEVPADSHREIPGLHPWRVIAYGCNSAKLGVSNDRGHILDLSLGEFRAVLLGDQSGYSLHDLAHRLPPGPIDILLVPHHGLTTEGLAKLLLHLKPGRAWSSSGPRNFPLPVAPMLEHFGIPLETTLTGALRWSEE